MVLPHAQHLPATISAFFYFLWGWRFVGIWKSRLLPNRWGLLLLMTVGVAMLYGLHDGLFGRDAGTRLFLVALGLKLMELNGKREVYLVTFLAFIVAAAQFLYQQSVFMGIYTFAVSCLLLATLVMVNGQFSSPWPAIKTAGLLLTQALPIAVILFLLFPRFDPPRWAWFKEPHTAKTGLGDSMEPGSISELGLSYELAFRVKFEGRMPPANQRYWRGPVLAYTDGRRWVQIDGDSLAGPGMRPQFFGQAYRYQLLLEPQSRNWVYALDLPSEFPQQLRQTADYRLLSRESPHKHAEYELVSFPDYATGGISQTEKKQNLQLPPERSEKITQLVKQLHGFDQSAQSFIGHVLQHFRQEKFYYSLTPPLLDEPHPLETFLFKTRYGFCSHYAAAFVYMMRVANIPARVVTGYQGGKLNEMGGFLEVRQADAHAWAEVWLPHRGWVRVDPTAAIAPERVEQPINIDNVLPEGAINFSPDGHPEAANWLANARQLWGHLDYSWQRWVINYNHENQGTFLSAWGIGNVSEMLQWLLISIGVATALVSAAILWPKQRRQDQLLRAYQKFCRKLAHRGLVKSAGEGEQDFARRAALQFPKKSPEIDGITKIFVALRYGKQPNPEDMARLSALVRNFSVKQD